MATGSGGRSSGSGSSPVATYVVPQARPTITAVSNVSPVTVGQTMIPEVAKAQGLESLREYEQRVYGGKTQIEIEATKTTAPPPPTQTVVSGGGTLTTQVQRVTVQYREPSSGALITTQVPANQIPAGVTVIGNPALPADAKIVSSSNPLLAPQPAQPVKTSLPVTQTTTDQYIEMSQTKPHAPVPLSQAGQVYQPSMPAPLLPHEVAMNAALPTFQADLARIAFIKTEQQRMAEANAQKSAYIEKWWSELPIGRQVMYGLDASLRNIVSQPVDILLSGHNAPTLKELAYANVKANIAAKEEYGYVGGFGSRILSNEAALIAGGGLAAGAGLGLVSQIPKVGPTLATAAGAGAIGRGIYDIGKKTSEGDVRGALTEGLAFVAAAPFAGAGFEMTGGKTVPLSAIKEKIPAVSFGKPKGVFIEVGEVPIAQPEMPFKELIPPKNYPFDVYGGENSISVTRSDTGMKLVGRLVPIPQLTGNTEKPGDRWEAYVGKENLKTRTAELYIKPATKDIPEVMNALTGDLEYVRTPQGSMMKIKPVEPVTTESMSQTIDSRLSSGLKQPGIGDVAGQMPESKLPSLSDYVRFERKLYTEPAQLTRTAIPERLSLPQYTYDVDIQPEAPMHGKGTMANDVWGGSVSGKGMYPDTSLVEGVPNRLQLTPREVTDFDVQLSLMRKANIGTAPKLAPVPVSAPDRATTDLADSVRDALGDYGKYTEPYKAAKTYAATDKQISKVYTPASPVKIENVGNKQYAEDLAQNLAAGMQTKGMPVLAQKTTVMTRPTLNMPSEPLSNVQYFNQAKEAAPDRFDKQFGGSNLMGMNALSFDIRRSQQAGDVNFINRFFGENPADVGLFNYTGVTGYPEVTKKKKPQPVGIPLPKDYPYSQPQPQPQPFPQPQPQPNPEPTGDGGGGWTPPPPPEIKIPKIKLPEYTDIMGKKKKKYRKEKYFHTFRASPIMPASTDLSGIRKALGLSTKTGKKKKK